MTPLPWSPVSSPFTFSSSFFFLPPPPSLSFFKNPDILFTGCIITAEERSTATQGMVDKFFFSPLASPFATWILNGVSRNASRDPSILEETSRYVRSADFLIGEKKRRAG